MEVKAVLAEALAFIGRARRLYPPRSDVEEAALRWLLYASLQNILDAMAMIAADLDLPKPRGYAGLGRVLGEAGLLNEEAVEAAVLIARTRNVLAHTYRRVSVEELGEMVSRVLPEAEKLAEKLIEAIERRGLDPPGLSNHCREGVEELRRKLHGVFAGAGIRLAYLFGSRARCRARPDSDYDIAVLPGKPLNILDEARLAERIAEKLGVPVDMVDLVRLDRADPLLTLRILREGVPLHGSPGERRRWERKALITALGELDAYETYVHRKLRGRRLSE